MRALAPVRSEPLYSPSRRWTIVVLLALVCVIAYVDRVNLSFAIIDQDFKQFFQLSNSERGVLNSAFFWSYAALQIPAGWIVDKYGSKYPLALSIAVWSILTAVTSFATGYSVLFALRLLLGVGEAAMHPASIKWIRDNFSESRRGLAIGLFMSGSKFGPAIGATASAVLIESYGWRAMFLILGAAGLVWLLPWLALTRADKPKPAQLTQSPGLSDETSLGKLIVNPIIIGTIVATFSYMYFVYFCLTWMPAYLNEARGLSLGSSGLFTTFSFAGMATVAIFAGAAADWIISRGHNPVTVRKAFTIAAFVLASMEIFSIALPTGAAVWLSVISLSGLGLATANYWALTQTLIPTGAVGRIVGIQNCAASVSGIVAPILTGWLVQRTGGYSAALVAVLLILFAGVLAYLFLVREKYSVIYNKNCN